MTRQRDSLSYTSRFFRIYGPLNRIPTLLSNLGEESTDFLEVILRPLLNRGLYCSDTMESMCRKDETWV